VQQDEQVLAQFRQGQTAVLREKLGDFANALIGLFGDDVNFEAVAGAEDGNFVDVRAMGEMGNRVSCLSRGNAEFFANLNGGSFMAQANYGDIHSSSTR
jgi:hypothetical protein